MVDTAVCAEKKRSESTQNENSSDRKEKVKKLDNKILFNACFSIETSPQYFFLVALSMNAAGTEEGQWSERKTILKICKQNFHDNWVQPTP